MFLTYERSERPYIKEHSDTTVLLSFVDKNSEANFVQKLEYFFLFLANKILNICLFYIILSSLKAELSELNKSSVSFIRVVKC